MLESTIGMGVEAG